MAGGGKGFELEAAVLEVLVEGGEDEAGEQGEEVAEPRIGFPEIEEDSGFDAPVEGHVHHLCDRFELLLL